MEVLLGPQAALLGLQVVLLVRFGTALQAHPQVQIVVQVVSVVAILVVAEPLAISKSFKESEF